MKPKFSILTLLGVTAYVAVNVAALAQPGGPIKYIAYFVGIAATTALLPVAAGPTNRISVFARGVFLGIILYQCGREWEPYDPKYWDDGIFKWPSMVEWSPKFAAGYAQNYSLTSIIYLNAYIAWGLLCGCLSLWYYRRQEQRATKEKSGE